MVVDKSGDVMEKDNHSKVQVLSWSPRLLYEKC